MGAFPKEKASFFLFSQGISPPVFILTSDFGALQLAVRLANPPAFTATFALHHFWTCDTNQFLVRTLLCLLLCLMVPGSFPQG